MDSSYVLIQTILTAKVAQLRAMFFHQVSVCEAHAFRVGRSTFWAKILAFSCKKKKTQAWLYIHVLFEAICSLQTFSLILTAKVLVAPTLTTGALCTWNSGRVGLLSYHVTAEKIFLKTSVK